MNISKADYENLKEIADAFDDEVKDGIRARNQASNLRKALEDVLNVANGGVPGSTRGSRRVYDGDCNVMGSFSPRFGHDATVPLSDAERHEQYVQGLNDRIVRLESRLSSVTTAAQMALEHLA